jgi:ADP-ribose pyrophosphatase YjhB (NUDIX family)
MRNDQVVEQAGAITIKKENNEELLVLLVRSKKDPSHWVLPKGHMEEGETTERTALRELHEEAGVIGEILEKAGEIEFSRQGNIYHVTYFYCKFIERSGEGEDGRNPQWYTIEKAKDLLRIFPGTNDMIDTIRQLRI